MTRITKIIVASLGLLGFMALVVMLATGHPNCDNKPAPPDEDVKVEQDAKQGASTGASDKTSSETS